MCGSIETRHESWTSIVALKGAALQEHLPLKNNWQKRGGMRLIRHCSRRERRVIILLKRRPFKEAAALKAVVCGGSWTADRSDEQLQCRACGMPDTALHRYWEFFRLEASGEKEIMDTQWMR